MDSLKDILGDKRSKEPEEVRIIKQFVQDTFQSDCRVYLKPNLITIAVSSASLAGALRPKLHELQTLCETKNRLQIRIGS